MTLLNKPFLFRCFSHSQECLTGISSHFILSCTPVFGNHCFPFVNEPNPLIFVAIREHNVSHIRPVNFFLCCAKKSGSSEFQERLGTVLVKYSVYM